MSRDLPRAPNLIDEHELFEQDIFANASERVERRLLFDIVSQRAKEQQVLADKWAKDECMLGLFYGAFALQISHRKAQT